MLDAIARVVVAIYFLAVLVLMLLGRRSPSG